MGNDLSEEELAAQKQTAEIRVRDAEELLKATTKRLEEAKTAAVEHEEIDALLKEAEAQKSVIEELKAYANSLIPGNADEPPSEASQSVAGTGTNRSSIAAVFKAKSKLMRPTKANRAEAAKRATKATALARELAEAANARHQRNEKIVWICEYDAENAQFLYYKEGTDKRSSVLEAPSDGIVRYQMDSGDTNDSFRRDGQQVRVICWHAGSTFTEGQCFYPTS